MKLRYMDGTDRRGNPVYVDVPEGKDGQKLLETLSIVSVWPDRNSPSDIASLDQFARELMDDYGYKFSEPVGKTFPQGRLLRREERKVVSVDDARKAWRKPRPEASAPAPAQS